jgi:hypothetical protein
MPERLPAAGPLRATSRSGPDTIPPDGRPAEQADGARRPEERVPPIRDRSEPMVAPFLGSFGPGDSGRWSLLIGVGVNENGSVLLVDLVKEPDHASQDF